jgi:hypothetical protein
MLAGLALLPAIAPTMAAARETDDPIFAAIEAHREAGKSSMPRARG